MLLLAACTVMPYHRPPDTSLLVAPPAAAPAVDVSGLLGRLDALLAATSSVDVRDRLVELRELVLGAASGDAFANLGAEADSANADVDAEGVPIDAAAAARAFVPEFDPAVPCSTPSGPSPSRSVRRSRPSPLPRA